MSPEAILFLIALLFLIILLVTTYKKLQAIRKRFQPVIFVEKEIVKLTNKRNGIIEDTEKLKVDYTEKRTTFDRLKKELASYNEKLSFSKDEVKKLTNKRNGIIEDTEKLKVDYTEKRTTFDRLKKELASYNEKLSFSKDEVEKLTNKRNGIIEDTKKLKTDYAEKRTIFDRLKKELASYDEKLSFFEMGIYEPYFDFTDTKEFKEQIKSVREKQKSLVKDKTAITCGTEWQVEGSKAKGRTMTNRNIRLTLRAFNNECEAAIANVRWNNINAMEKRILRAEEQIDKMNASNNIIIERHYIDLKLKELRLTHEYRELLQEEKEKRREQARLEREEKKLIEEVKAAEKEEEKYRKLLEKAKEEVKKALGVEDNEKLQSRIEELEKSLQEANEKKERAQSMAEQTRIGHIYVISNIGSFGEEIVKIGMTRRLNPEERVKELGDASVPFVFDTHAMIYTEDAPTIEKELHRRFHARRVNAVNMRKEFFRVGLDEVASTIKELDPNASFVMEREARDYMETLAVQRQEAETLEEDVEDEFPMSL